MKKDEQKSREGEWLETMFRQCPDGIVLQDNEGAIFEANPAFAKFCQRPLSAILGKKFAEFLDPASRSQWNHDLAKLVKGEWSNLEELCIFADGHKTPIRVDFIGRTSHKGRSATMLHISNLAPFYKVESALVASENQWELSFNAIGDMMLILDHQALILRANQVALKKIAPLKLDPIGAAFFDIFQIKTNGGTWDALRQKIFSAPCALTGCEFKGLAGKYACYSYPIRDDGQARAGCIIIIKDVTEQFRQEALLKSIELRRQRGYRIEALGRLAGGIAHDFNNILTTLLGYVSLALQSANLGQNERTALLEIMRTIERGTALTRQLFDFSAEKKNEFKPVNLNDVIRNMQKMLIQTLGPNIALTTRLDQELWNINADVSRLERIVMNFATNSRDAMPGRGEFIIETINTTLDDNFCKNHPELKAGNYVLLQVSDDGPGMLPEVHDRIFEPFFTTKNKGKGLGLGLSSVFGIVRQFGGEIICYTEPGQGATFKVYLPQSNAPAIPEKPAVTLQDLPGGSETILIVDDEIHIVSMLKQILTKIGYTVLSATKSSQAIALCKEYQGAIDVVLSDIIMPDMNGVELVASLREMHPQLQPVFMSGYTNNMAIESAGMDKKTVFLQKPFTFEELAQKIRLALKNNLSNPPAEGGRMQKGKPP